TIGTYIAAMGVGAMLYQYFQTQDQLSLLFKIEVLICVLGAAVPIAVVVGDFYLQGLSTVVATPWQETFLVGGRYLVNYALIVLIGIISGIELPLLMQMGELQSKGLGLVIL